MKYGHSARRTSANSYINKSNHPGCSAACRVCKSSAQKQLNTTTSMAPACAARAARTAATATCAAGAFG